MLRREHTAHGGRTKMSHRCMSEILSAYQLMRIDSCVSTHADVVDVGAGIARGITLSTYWVWVFPAVEYQHTTCHVHKDNVML